MREAIGGAWLYYIFVVMIMFLVSFLAIFLNYMTAYRANNHLISILEQSDGIMPAGIEQQLNANFSYTSSFRACYMQTTSSRTGKGFIVRIATFMPIRIPLVNIEVTIPVKNETRTINCYGNDDCPNQTVLGSLATSGHAVQQCTSGW